MSHCTCEMRVERSEQHINFTVRSSLPELVQSSLELSQTEFVTDERVTLEVLSTTHR